MNTSTVQYSKPFLTIEQQIEQLKSCGMHHLTVIRNICAHHSVLWNKKLTLEFVIPKSMQERYNKEERRKLFNTIVMTEFLLDKISDNNHWRTRLESLIDKHGIDRHILGYKGLL